MVCVWFVFNSQASCSLCCYSTTTTTTTTSTTIAHGNRRIYNRLIKYTAPRTQLSEDDNTELITMIKAISRINGTEIPLPSRYLHSFDISNVLKGLCLCV